MRKPIIVWLIILAFALACATTPRPAGAPVFTFEKVGFTEVVFLHPGEAVRLRVSEGGTAGLEARLAAAGFRLVATDEKADWVLTVKPRPTRQEVETKDPADAAASAALAGAGLGGLGALAAGEKSAEAVARGVLIGGLVGGLIAAIVEEGKNQVAMSCWFDVEFWHRPSGERQRTTYSVTVAQKKSGYDAAAAYARAEELLAKQVTTDFR